MASVPESDISAVTVYSEKGTICILDRMIYRQQ
jgi:hypothetical protein